MSSFNSINKTFPLQNFTFPRFILVHQFASSKLKQNTNFDHWFASVSGICVFSTDKKLNELTEWIPSAKTEYNAHYLSRRKEHKELLIYIIIFCLKKSTRLNTLTFLYSKIVSSTFAGDFFLILLIISRLYLPISVFFYCLLTFHTRVKLDLNFLNCIVWKWQWLVGRWKWKHRKLCRSRPT